MNNNLGTVDRFTRKNDVLFIEVPTKSSPLNFRLLSVLIFERKNGGLK